MKLYFLEKDLNELKSHFTLLFRFFRRLDFAYLSPPRIAVAPLRNPPFVPSIHSESLSVILYTQRSFPCLC